MDKKILDATCGSRMIWFNENHPLALYVDRREVEDEVIWTASDGSRTRYLTVKPDVIADFTELPFEDNSFYLVVFDPPHNGYYYCSECGAVSPQEDQDGEYIDCPRFCPNCGAEMRKEAKE